MIYSDTYVALVDFPHRTVIQRLTANSVVHVEEVKKTFRDGVANTEELISATSKAISEHMGYQFSV